MITEDELDQAVEIASRVPLRDVVADAIESTAMVEYLLNKFELWNLDGTFTFPWGTVVEMIPKEFDALDFPEAEPHV